MRIQGVSRSSSHTSTPHPPWAPSLRRTPETMPLMMVMTMRMPPPRIRLPPTRQASSVPRAALGRRPSAGPDPAACASDLLLLQRVRVKRRLLSGRVQRSKGVPRAKSHPFYRPCPYVYSSHAWTERQRLRQRPLVAYRHTVRLLASELHYTFRRKAGSRVQSGHVGKQSRIQRTMSTYMYTDHYIAHGQMHVCPPTMSC